jgi:hypothetical protein
MAWGLGLADDYSVRVMKGAKDVLGYGAGQLGGFMSKEYSSFKGSIGKASDKYIEGYKQRRSDIAQGVKTDSKGIRYSEYSEDNFLKDYYAPRGSKRREFYNTAVHNAKDMGKGLGVSAALGGAIYGLSAFATDNSDNDMSDRGINFAKHGVALGADLAGDTAIAGIGMGLSMLGPMGALAGGVLNVANIAAGLMGYDAGSIAMNVMNYAEEAHDKARNGPKFNMTQNTSMALERQIQNLHASGSNLGEMMHN